MKSFESYLEFYNFLKDNDVHGKDTVLLPFLNACGSIGKGCSCSKQKRIDRAIAEYLSLGDKLTKEYADAIKSHPAIQADVVKFLHNDVMFYAI